MTFVLQYTYVVVNIATLVKSIWTPILPLLDGFQLANCYKRASQSRAIDVCLFNHVSIKAVEKRYRSTRHEARLCPQHGIESAIRQ